MHSTQSSRGGKVFLSLGYILVFYQVHPLYSLFLRSDSLSDGQGSQFQKTRCQKSYLGGSLKDNQEYSILYVSNDKKGSYRYGSHLTGTWEVARVVLAQ